MKIDTCELAHGQTIESDVCVIGAGPAGTTLAREFLNTTSSVSLLESGSNKAERRTQRLSEGVLSGELYEPLEETHIRQVGGTANHWILKMADKQWGYRYTTFDEIDFEHRTQIPNSGWPIQKAELEPYYARAHEVCEIGPYQYAAKEWSSHNFSPMRFSDGKVMSGVFLFGPTRKFRLDFPAQIASSLHINIYTHATVVELICSADGLTVESALVRTFEGKEIYFKAKQFVIASNALQTPRLLLNSKRQHPNGIGNQHDNVGRYYMDHAVVSCGNFYPHDLKLINKLGFYDFRLVGSTTVMGSIKLTDKTKREEGLNNLGAMFIPMPEIKDIHALVSFKTLMTDLIARRFPKNIFEHLIAMYRGKGHLLRMTYERVRYNTSMQPGFGNGGWSQFNNNEKKYRRLELMAIIEQSPNRNNRVTLSEDKDELGCPKIKVHYAWTAEDIESIARTQKILAQAFNETGLGNFEQPKQQTPELIRESLGIHHMMGTARMNDDPKYGVVDRDCKVHGMSNLFIASSATFSTGSYANPTLTNLALSIRVADKVKDVLCNG